MYNSSIITRKVKYLINFPLCEKIRDKINNRYRIRISKTSMDILTLLVKDHIHTDFLYKLGL